MNRNRCKTSKSLVKPAVCLTFGLAFGAVSFVPAPLTALASPEFAYSTERWAQLKDNVLEYDEIGDLIHEYNPTVRSNRSTYKDQKGKDLNDVYQDYMNDIDDIWDQADAATDDVTWASLKYSAGLLTKQADNNYEDADME